MYIDPIVKNYIDEGGYDLETCCATCPASRWFSTMHKDFEMMVCICPPLKFKSYVLGEVKIQQCTQKEIVMQEYANHKIKE